MVVFDGQSLNHTASPTTFPAETMDGILVPWHAPAVSGTSWSGLSVTADDRCYVLAKPYSNAILVMTGGTSDIYNAGDDDTAATALADMESYAAAARTVGFAYIIACTITPATIFDDDDEEQRVALNASIRTSDSWDAVADLAAVDELADETDATYYSDGLHWTAAGNAAAAAVVAPLIAAAI